MKEKQEALKVVTGQELFDKIAGEDINFLGFAVTPWSAHGVDAYISYLNENGFVAKGYVCITEHPQAGVMLDSSYFAFLNDNIKILLLKGKPQSRQAKKAKIAGLLLNRKNQKKDFFIVQQGATRYDWYYMLRYLQKDKNVISVIIDEGLGMYMRDKNAWLKEALNNADSVVKKLKAVLLQFVITPTMNWLIRYRRGEQMFSLLDVENRNAVPNEKAVLYYRNAIKAQGKKIENEDLMNYGKALIINTQPFFEYGLVRNDEDLKVLKEVCAVCKKHNIPVVLKPHPRECNLERYNELECYMDLQKGRSQESILVHLKEKPVAIVGFSSTTLVSAKIFEKVTTVSLIDYIKRENIGESALMDFEGFKKVFEDYAEFPKTIKELEQVLVNCIEENIYKKDNYGGKRNV